jgi:acyl dehydratase
VSVLDGPVISQGARALVGKVVREFVTDPISLRQIREYLAGTGDPTDVLPSGDDADAISEVIAPPLFFVSASRLVVDADTLLEDGQYPFLGVGVTGRSVVSGSTAEFLAPIRVGDVLYGEERLVGITEKSGRSGPLVFVETKTTYRNQHQQPVASYSMTVVFR